MNRLLILMILTGFSRWAFCQTCIHTDLSNQFDIDTSIRRIIGDSCLVSIEISDKDSHKTATTIQYRTLFLNDTVFRNCKSVRSYQTHKNDTLEAVDNDYGNFIVADFNFDGLDDLAIIRDSGGNSGSLYNFYIQREPFFSSYFFILQTPTL